eukprot:Rmarinus@m.17616
MLSEDTGEFRVGNRINLPHGGGMADYTAPPLSYTERDVPVGLYLTLFKQLLQRISTEGKTREPRDALDQLLVLKARIPNDEVLQALQSEHAALISALEAELSRTRDDVDRLDESTRHVSGMSPAIYKLMMMRRLKERFEYIDEELRPLLEKCSDGDTSSRLVDYTSQSKEFLNSLKRDLKELFTKWTDDVDKMLVSGSASDRMNKYVMFLDKTDGKLVVNYSSWLMQLMQDVHYMEVLKPSGADIPRSIKEEAVTADKIAHFATVLMQVSNFYNTSERNILKCTKGMLLKPAQKFESLVRHPHDASDGKTITWSSVSSLERYIEELQGAMDELRTKNDEIRVRHFELKKLCSQVATIDLVTQQEKLRTILSKMRSLVDGLEAKGYENTEGWRWYWDHHLYMVLKCQYRRGLETFNESLPQREVSLSFENGRLVLVPPFEDVVSWYQAEIRKFVAIPSRFGGLGNRQLYRQMIYECPELHTVYMKARALYERLKSVISEYDEWIVLGKVDLEEHIAACMSTAADFNSNLRFLRNKARQASALPTIIDVDCLKISLLPLKNAIQQLINKAVDLIAYALRSSAQGDFEKLESFVKEGMEILKRRPDNIRELGEVRAEAMKLKQNLLEVKQQKSHLDAKNRLLESVRSWTIGAKPLDLAAMQASWEEFELMLEAHEAVIEHQRDQLRRDIDSRISQFEENVQKFASKWEGLRPRDDDIEKGDAAAAVKTLERVKNLRAELAELQDMAKLLTQDCEHFELQVPQFPLLTQTEKDIETTAAGWVVFEEYTTDLDALANEDWITFRATLYKLEDFAQQWYEKLRQRQVDAMSLRLQKELELMTKCGPALKLVRGDVFTPEHWGELFRLVGMSRELTIETLKVQHFLAVRESLIDKFEPLRALAARAQGEVTIRQAINDLRVWGSQATFSLSQHAPDGARPCTLIKDWKDLMTQIGDQQSLLSSLKVSPFARAFSDVVDVWEKRLTLLDECLHLLNPIQRKWVYLEPIFRRGALPNEQAKFNRVDTEFRRILKEIEQDPRVIELVNQHSLKEKLQGLLSDLDRFQKALSDYLEEKRAVLPRFYFIGDDDLLEILGQSKDPTVIQSHLKKLFAGIHRVLFDDDNNRIVSMVSLMGEVVDLIKPVEITEKVEEWLSDLSVQMQNTLRHMLVQCIDAKNKMAFPSQIICLSEMVKFTSNTEKAIKGKLLPQLIDQLRSHLKHFTEYDTGGDAVLSLKVKAIVLDLIHNIDVVELLRERNVTQIDDWSWHKQLRYYVEGGKCIVRMTEAAFDYTYEYQGNAPKLVHTPLTDKCYLTLTKGMHLGYGGNPYGPAGTGKTESVKALGQALGRQVLVFNCDEGIDYQSMGRIFTGIVKCGAWGCFDEFNRLEEDVLSAVSQQIQVIQAALKERTPSLQLLSRGIDVNFNAGIFVTLNPAGKGYGGRSKLPDNLKQLFRAVAMSAPDNELIAEVLLFAEGFSEAKELGRKAVRVFSLSRQLLSEQQHYDWGLRALKTVLRVAGELIQTARRKKQDCKEAEILIQSLRVNTLSKLTYSDAHNFESIIVDVFPKVRMTDVSYDEVEAAVRDVLKSKNLEVVTPQVQKILQFYEATKQRMGVVIVGPSGCGKTVIWTVLQEALNKIGKKVKLHVFNPKAIPRNQLLGHMDMDTREWFDGVLTSAARAVVKEDPDVTSWIVSDGDIDPEWVESLNSVLDDNRLLTMPSGERIQFGPNVNFVFETHSLQHASPATVSRMGMIFLSDEMLDVNALKKSWLNNQPEDKVSLLDRWFDDIFMEAVKWVESKQCEVVRTTKVGLVWNGLSHLKNVDNKVHFAISLARGITANIAPEFATELAQFIFEKAREAPPDVRRPLDCCYDADSQSLRPLYATEAAPPNADTLIKHGCSGQGGVPVVPTVGVRRIQETVMRWLEDGDPFLLAGPAGCGKSMVLSSCFEKLANCKVAIVHCSAQTAAKHVINKIEQSCICVSSSNGRVFRPKESEKLVLYLKDLNLAKPDKYDTIQLVAFLQQIIAYKGFYDSNLEWVGLSQIQIVGSIQPGDAMGRHLLNTRFTAAVRLAYMTYPESDELTSVFVQMLQGVLGAACPTNAVTTSTSRVEQLSAVMVELYEKIKETFTPSTERHYVFTPRHLTEWVVGLLRYDFPEDDADADGFFTMWAYEAVRLFRDRLVGAEAQFKFDNLLATAAGRLGAHASTAGIYFSTWAAAAGGAPGQMRRLGEMGREDFIACVKNGIKDYERHVKDLNLVILPELLDTVAALDRVLVQPGGSMMLCGRSGVGRRSLIQLVAYVHDMTLFSPKMGRNYDYKSFGNDLKQVFQATAVEGTPAVLLIEDYQADDPQFLQAINSLLSGGEVPGLYAPEEMDALLQPLREVMQTEGADDQSPHDFFVSRVRANLHVILSMDPTHTEFLQRCENNPAVYTRCSILWLDSWSDESMLAVASTLLMPLFNEVGLDNDARERIPACLCGVHRTCLRLGAAPRDFVSNIELYSNQYRMQSGKNKEQESHLRGGLKKLKEAEATTDELQRNASSKGALLKRKQQEGKEALERIKISMKRATEKKEEAKQLSQQLAVEEGELATRKEDVERELSDALPMLEQARQSVNQIRSEHLNEIKSYQSLPAVTHHVLTAVLFILGNEDTSVTSIKRFLSRRGAKDDILNYDARTLDRNTRRQVEEFLIRNKESFSSERVKSVSKAVAPLAQWVKANIKYAHVLERVSPMESEMNRLSSGLQKARRDMQRCNEEVEALDEECEQLQNEYQQKNEEAAVLKVDLDKTKTTLEAASQLFGKLIYEKERWGKQVDEMEAEAQYLPWHALLASSFMTYLPGHDEDTRTQLIDEWFRILGTGDFGFLKFMATETQLLKWKSEGLPADDLSMENALVIKNTNRFPFIIDPSTRAIEWLKVHMQGKSLEVLNQQDARFTTQLELAVRFGKTLIIQEVERVEPMLYPLLRRDLLNQGSRKMVQIGDKVIDFNDQFRLYLTTRNPEPSLPADAKTIVSEVNFTVTRSGLEGQLLGLTIASENPELEQQRSALLASEEELKMELADLEKRLLEELAMSEGNLLENKTLIVSLDETKVKSRSVQAKLDESAQVQQRLEKQRNMYQSIAHEGSKLFFLIRDLHRLSPMYQFSLSSFLRLFKKAFKLDETRGSVDQRLASLSKTLRHLVFDSVARALFKSDRLAFAMHLAHGMRPDALQQGEWDYLLGRVPLEKSESGLPPAWIDSERGVAFSSFKRAFPTLAQKMTFDDTPTWTQWSKSSQCELEFPAKVASCTSAFQRLLLVQAVKPGRMASAMTEFVCDVLSLPSIAPPAVNLQQLFQEETVNTEPVLLMATAGADPSQELEEVASRVVGRDRYQQLAMGQGQSQLAVSMLRDCASSGQWLCLKNVHLVTGWLPVLEKELKSLNPHPDFRLWMTTESHPKFPPILLEGSLKVTFEAPPGVKKNLERTYEMWPSEVIQQLSPVAAQMYFVLAWFHAIVQERRKYIPQAWTKVYEFSTADLRSGADVLREACASGSEDLPPWATIHGLLENAIYGGRVDDKYDVRILRAYIEQFFAPDIISTSRSRASRRLAQNVVMPASKSRNEYVSVIQSLGDHDSPALFDLPPNIDNAVQKTISMGVVNQLKSLSMHEASTKLFNRKQWANQLNPLLTAWHSRVNKMTQLRAPVSAPAKDAPPLHLFMYREVTRALHVVEVIHSSLELIRAVINGKALLTPETHKVAASLLADDVPSIWQDAWEGPESPLSYTNAVLDRAGAVLEMLGHRGGVSSVRLRNFFRPMAFLNALCQQTARKLGRSMDELKLVVNFGRAEGDGVKVEGLLIQSALISGGVLSECGPNSPPVTEVPPCFFQWIPQEKPDPYPAKSTLPIPIYESTSRERLLTEVKVPCSSSPHGWIVRAVAMFLFEVE